MKKEVKQPTRKKVSTNKNSKPEIPVLKNPVESRTGKIVIWFLIFGMGGIILVSLIATIISILFNL